MAYKKKEMHHVDASPSYLSLYKMNVLYLFLSLS